MMGSLSHQWITCTLYNSYARNTMGDKMDLWVMLKSNQVVIASVLREAISSPFHVIASERTVRARQSPRHTGIASSPFHVIASERTVRAWQSPRHTGIASSPFHVIASERTVRAWQSPRHTGIASSPFHVIASERTVRAWQSPRHTGIASSGSTPSSQ
jgi:hypothetical protein